MDTLEPKTEAQIEFERRLEEKLACYLGAASKLGTATTLPSLIVAAAIIDLIDELQRQA